MKGDCLAYVAYCSLELATEIFPSVPAMQKMNKKDRKSVV